MKKSRHFGTALLCAIGLVSSPGFVAIAPAQDSGGRTLTFGIDQRLEVSDNIDLAVTSPGSTQQSITRLSFGLRDETATTTLALDVGAGLRIAGGPGFSGTSVRLSDPSLALAYSRLGVNSQLDVTASVADSDIAFLRPLEDFQNIDGTFTFPDDIADLTGTGTRRSLNFDTKLTLRKDDPLGVILTAGASQLRYLDAWNPALIDSNRQYVGAALQFEVSPVTEATVGLTYAIYNDPTVSRTTTSFNAGLSVARPDGSLNLNLAADDTPDGTRLSISAGRDFELPRGAVSFDLGATRGVAGEIDITGGLDLRLDLPNGGITAGVSRSVGAGSNDTERLRTAVNLGYNRELSARSTLNLDLAYVESQSTAVGTREANASVGATYGLALGPDWTMDLGYRHVLRDSDTLGRADENSVFLGLRRNFQGGF